MRELEDSELEKIAGGFERYPLEEWICPSDTGINSQELIPVSRPYHGTSPSPQILETSSSHPQNTLTRDGNFSGGSFWDEGGFAQGFTSENGHLRHHYARIHRSRRNQQNTQDSNYSPTTLSYKTPYLNR
ncbi:MAG: hypothetical protein COA43_15645 [Robiginitomaculum sp.]|nr:MAG: hypothetical protein COA43_15645 [Robiginitomaculum sp.]